MFYLRDGGYKFTGEGGTESVFAFDNHDGCVIYFNSAKKWDYMDQLDLYWEGVAIATIGLEYIYDSDLNELYESGALEEADED